MGGVPFSLLAWIPWEVSMAHRFHRKSPKSLKSAQNRGTPQIKATLPLLFSINLAQKRCLYLTLPLLGPKKIYRRESVAFIKVLPLLGKQRKILVHALIRSVASTRQLPLFGQKRTLVKKKKAKKGSVCFLRLWREKFRQF